MFLNILFVWIHGLYEQILLLNDLFDNNFVVFQVKRICSLFSIFTKLNLWNLLLAMFSCLVFYVKKYILKFKLNFKNIRLLEMIII